MHPSLDCMDARISRWMYRHGHRWHRLSLGVLFLWFGALKVSAHPTATSLIAETVYAGDPATVTPLLGAWEAAIGACLLWRPLVRLALLLLAIRLPGTVLALVLLPEISFTEVPFVPSPEGQYLLKDLALFSAAMVIGGTLRDEPEHER